MDGREFNQMMLPPPPPRGEVIWSRAVALLLCLVCLVVFWGAVAYGVAQVIA